MRSWSLLLAGLLIWAAHFFILYGIGEFAGDGEASRIATAFTTLLALTLLAIIALRVARLPTSAGFEAWRRTSGLFGALLGALGVLWQSLPLIPSLG